MEEAEAMRTELHNLEWPPANHNRLIAEFTTEREATQFFKNSSAPSTSTNNNPTPTPTPSQEPSNAAKGKNNQNAREREQKTTKEVKKGKNL